MQYLDAPMSPMTEGGNPNEKGKLSKKDILSIVKSDYSAAKHYTAIQMTKIAKWRKEYNGCLYGNESKGKSPYVNREIKKHSAWLQSSLIDPFTSTPDIVRCYPAIPTSTKAARASEVVLNAQFCRQFNRFNFMSEVISVLETDGTVVIKTGWEYHEEERKVKYSSDIPLNVLGEELQEPIPEQELQQIAQTNPQEAQLLQALSTPLLDELGRQQVSHQEAYQDEVVPVVNQPTACICRNEDIFIDPTCLGKFDDAQFIIHRYQTDLSTLRADTRYKNIDKLRTTVEYSMDPEYQRKESFFFNDIARKKLVVYEYWGNIDANGDGIVEPMVITWCNDVIIRMEENPYPDKKPPFIVSPFLPVPFDIYGEPNAELLGDNQKLKTAIMRGVIDNMSNSNNAQIGVLRGILNEENRDKMLRGENFTFEQRLGNDGIFVGNYNQLPSSIFNVLQLVDSESQQLTGVNTVGNYQSSNRIGSDNASKGLLDGGNLRKLQIVKSISENVVIPLLRKWLEYDAWLLEDEQVFRLTGGEYFETIKRDDLYGRIDIDLTISTNEDNAVRTNQLAFLLQTIGPNEDPNIRKMIMSEIMRLHKMPELATRLENYEPKPDPLEQAYREAELERLRAEIEELKANAGKIRQDGVLKSAKAEAESERAKETKAKTDKTNLEFMREQQGINDANRFRDLQSQLESKERIAQMNNEAKLQADSMKFQQSQMQREQQQRDKELEKEIEENKKKAEQLGRKVKMINKIGDNKGLPTEPQSRTLRKPPKDL